MPPLQSKTSAPPEPKAPEPEAPETDEELHVTVPGQGATRFVPPAARLIGQEASKAQRAIKFSCGCGQVLHSRRLPGTHVMCPACGQIVEVPGDRQDEESAVAEAYKPRVVIDFQCECGDTLRAEEGVGSSVMCLNCGREAIATADGKIIVQFQCPCGAILETEETAGAEITCPACNNSVPVPKVEQAKG